MATRRQLLTVGLAAGVTGCTDRGEDLAWWGATITAFPEGAFVPGAGVTSSDVETVEAALQRTAGVDPDRVRVFTGDTADAVVPDGTVEVRGQTDPEKIATALQDAGVDVEAADVRPGVTVDTADRIVERS